MFADAGEDFFVGVELEELEAKYPELKMAEIKSHKMALMILYEFEGTTIE